MSEQVLVVDRHRVDIALGIPSTSDVKIKGSVVISPNSLLDFADLGNDSCNVQERLGATFRERDEVETDPSVVQLIPYVVLLCKQRSSSLVFSYFRSKKSGESRLQGKMSVGIGGHINPVDGGGNCYLNALRREMVEELGCSIEDLPLVDGCDPYKVHGIIRDTTTAVNEVHVGVLHVLSLQEIPRLKCEDTKLEPDFRNIDFMIGVHDLETWTDMTLRHLIPYVSGFASPNTV